MENNIPINQNYEITKNKVLSLVHNNLDILCREFLINNETKACAFFLDGMSGKEDLAFSAIRPLMKATENFPTTTEYIHQNIVSTGETSIIFTIDQMISRILNGDCIIYIDGNNSALVLGTRKWNTRSISEPPTSTVVKGPREGFTEDLKQNMTLIRRKLRTRNLVYKHLTIGSYTKTNVMVTYLSGIASEKLVRRIVNRLKQIDIDGILDASYISDFLTHRPYSIFKQVGSTEKPDILVSKLLEGRIAIIVDNSPIVLSVPFIIMEDFQGSEDYYSRPAFATFSRIIRFFAILIAIILPGLFVAIKVFHPQFLPLKLSLTLSHSLKALPFSAGFEMLTTLIIFEVLREAGVRMPKHVGTAISVIGALVLSETAVSAGIITTSTLLVMALSGIALYTVPEQENALSLLRLVFLATGTVFGIIGIITTAIFVITYLTTIQNYGTPILSPFAPIVKNDLKDGIYKKSLVDLNSRPESFENENPKRLNYPN